MPFTDQEYFEVIEKNETVKKAFENIKQICIDLQKETTIVDPLSSLIFYFYQVFF